MIRFLITLTWPHNIHLTGLITLGQTIHSLPWRHNEHDSVSNHQPHECLLIRLIGADQRKHQSSASLAFVRGIHRRPVNSPHKGPVTRKMFPFDDVIMYCYYHICPRYFLIEDPPLHASPRHQMETFSALLALCEGNHRSPVDSPHEDQWRGALMFSLICLTKRTPVIWDVRHRAHYGVTVMLIGRYVENSQNMHIWSECLCSNSQDSGIQFTENGKLSWCQLCRRRLLHSNIQRFYLYPPGYPSKVWLELNDRDTDVLNLVMAERVKCRTCDIPIF